ncbi:hypothetical protein [Glutamicibacter uratoxydans]|uniref:hypothetical protein n=1 Tax=Glutamicibacter uratoxydans TaxID=43667 RepID=UPI003D6DB774
MKRFKISELQLEEMELVRDGDNIIIQQVAGEPLTKPIPIRKFREMVSQAQTVQGLNWRLGQENDRSIQILATLAEKNPEAWSDGL